LAHDTRSLAGSGTAAAGRSRSVMTWVILAAGTAMCVLAVLLS
jgi:hypothetical protein